MTIALAILGLLLTVVVHELGHFVIALRMGATVKEFGIGMPPRLLTLGHIRGVPVVLNALPIGGYVRIPTGMTQFTDDDEPTDAVGLRHLPTSSQAAIYAAGPLANVVFAWLLCVGLAVVSGKGLMAPVLATQAVAGSFALMFNGLIALLGGVGGMLGPVGIVEQSAEVIATGWANGIKILVVLNLAIAFSNLIPIPILDGGRLLLLLVAAVQGKRNVSEVTELVVSGIAGVFLLVMFLVIMYRDIAALF